MFCIFLSLVWENKHYFLQLAISHLSNRWSLNSFASRLVTVMAPSHFKNVNADAGRAGQKELGLLGFVLAERVGGSHVWGPDQVRNVTECGQELRSHVQERSWHARQRNRLPASNQKFCLEICLRIRGDSNGYDFWTCSSIQLRWKKASKLSLSVEQLGLVFLRMGLHYNNLFCSTAIS